MDLLHFTSTVLCRIFYRQFTEENGGHRELQAGRRIALPCKCSLISIYCMASEIGVSR